MFERVGGYYYFFPTYALGKKVIWEGIDKDGLRVLDHFPKELIDGKPNDTELKIRARNGSVFQIIGTDKFDIAAIGTNPVGCVFSEYALQDPKVWDYIRPILAENGGWAIFLTTPRGLNHAWKLLQVAKNDPEHWFSQVLTVDDTHTIGPEVLAQERREMPQALFNQEYYCEFLENAGAFFRRITENTYSDERQHSGHMVQLGVDLAKYQDWTVITPFCLTCFVAMPQDRFNQVDWNLQKSRIEATYHRFKALKVIPDSTGVGDPIAEDLDRAGLTVEPFKFTEVSRRQLLDNLAVLLEQDKIKIPNDPGLVDELRSMVFTLSDSKGKLHVGVPENLHDDRIMSLALSVWGATEPIPAEEGEFELYGEQNFG